MAQHILSTAATMAGVCLTGIGLVKLLEDNNGGGLIIDELLAVDSGVFCGAMLFAFCAIQMEGKKGARQDAMASLWLFACGVVMMISICVLFAFDFG